MLGVPLWAGPSHVMKLGPIGIAGDLDQPVPRRHDHIQALAKRRRGRLSEHHGVLLNAGMSLVLCLVALKADQVRWGTPPVQRLRRGLLTPKVPGQLDSREEGRRRKSGSTMKK